MASNMPRDKSNISSITFLDKLVYQTSRLLYHLDFYVPSDKIYLKQRYINKVIEQYLSQYLTYQHRAKYPTKIASTSKPVSTGVLGDGSGLMDSAWPMKCHDLRHTSLSPYSTKGHYGRIKWSFSVAGPMESGIVIDNENTIYFGSWDYNLYALHSNGTKKWNYETGETIWSTPALAQDGTIYIGSWDCKLHALYPNGTLKWYYDTGFWVTSDPAISDDGTLYIGSGDNYLYALYPNGTLRWRFKTGGYVKSHPVIASDGTIYFSSLDGILYAVYPNGTLKWKNKNIKVSGCSSVALDTKGIIYTSGIEIICAVNPENGSIIWSYNPGKDLAMIHGSPALSSDGTLYIPMCNVDGNGGWIIAVNISTGAEVWRRKIGGWSAES
ncbi:MAG TPA: hypothetical protein ENI44_05055, partial [Thermoplasmatales archaeon]|nr:hypothetical protein [Thermoplasmatales archaeon]